MLVFWFWVVFILATFWFDPAFAQRLDIIQKCDGKANFDNQQEALGCCLNLASVNTWLKTSNFCHEEFEPRPGLACVFAIDGNLRGGFNTSMRSRINGGGDGCNVRDWRDRGTYRLTFNDCEAGRPADFGSTQDETGGTACIEGCEADVTGCAGFSDQWFCTADTTGSTCEGAPESPTDQCDREPDRPECGCRTNEGAMDPACMCQADPLVFGDVQVCDDLTSGGGDDGGDDGSSDDSEQDSDGDGTPDNDDPCPHDPTPGCDDTDGEPDQDGDGNPDNTDPCPSDSSPDCDGSNSSGTRDTDGDGIDDASDPCPFDPDPECTSEGEGNGDVSDNECSQGLPKCEFPGSAACTFVRQLWRQRCDVDDDLSELGPKFRDQPAIWDDPDIQEWTNRDGNAAIQDRLDDVFDTSGFMSGSCPEIASVQVAGATLDFPDQTLCAFFAAAGWVVVAFSLIVAIRIVIGGM